MSKNVVPEYEPINEYEFGVRPRVMTISAATGILPRASDSWPRIREDDELSADDLAFLLFAGNEYAAVGGTGDFVGSYNTIGEAKDAIGHQDWGHIVVFRDGGLHTLLEWEYWLDEENQTRVRGWRRV